MRIVILAHNLRVAGGLSVGKNIVATLPEIAPMHKYLMIVPAGCGYPTSWDSPNVHITEVQQAGQHRRAAFDLWQLPRLVKEFLPDWVWGLGNMGLAMPPCRQAILFHDAHHVYPESHYKCESPMYKLKKRLVRHRLKHVLPKTDIVFCQTETVRRRFADIFAYSLDQTYVCPNAVSRLSAADKPGQRLPDALAPHRERFKLFVLTKCYGHKNLNGILDLYSKYRNELSDTVCILTISCDQHRIAPALLDRIEREGLGEMILNVGPLEQSEIGDYYSACDALFLPTLLESFSGTYLEAMHYGRPVITSDLDFAHDVCGDAALYCDPMNTESMRDAILECKESEQLRARLVEAGSLRLGSHYRSWPDVVRGALDVMGIEHN